MGELRERKRLAKEIRTKTGIPLGPASVIARHVRECMDWELYTNPVTAKYCVAKYHGPECCAYTELEVIGPKGKMDPKSSIHSR